MTWFLIRKGVVVVHLELLGLPAYIMVVVGPEVSECLLDSKRSESSRGVAVPTLFHHFAQDSKVLEKKRKNILSIN